MAGAPAGRSRVRAIRTARCGAPGGAATRRRRGTHRYRTRAGPHGTCPRARGADRGAPLARAATRPADARALRRRAPGRGARGVHRHPQAAARRARDRAQRGAARARAQGPQPGSRPAPATPGHSRAAGIRDRGAATPRVAARPGDRRRDDRVRAHCRSDRQTRNHDTCRGKDPRARRGVPGRRVGKAVGAGSRRPARDHPFRRGVDLGPAASRDPAGDQPAHAQGDAVHPARGHRRWKRHRRRRGRGLGDRALAGAAAHRPAVRQRDTDPAAPTRPVAAGNAGRRRDRRRIRVGGAGLVARPAT